MDAVDDTEPHYNIDSMHKDDAKDDFIPMGHELPMLRIMISKNTIDEQGSIELISSGFSVDEAADGLEYLISKIKEVKFADKKL